MNCGKPVGEVMVKPPPTPRPDVLAGAVVLASAATLVSAALATLAGSLRPWISATSLSVAVLAAVLAARAGVTPPHPPLWSSRRRWVDALALLAFASVSIRQFGWLVYERDGALLTLLPYNYGDLPLHWTYVQSLARGAAFWPGDPILSGQRLQYPFGVDLLTAVFVQFGASLPVLLRLFGLAGAALAALALRRWGGALAVGGFLFAGGLAGFQILWTRRLADYQADLAWKNLYLALFVPQRGFLLALPAGLLLLWSWHRRLLRGETGLPSWVEGLVWGALPLVHLHTFAIVSLLCAIWALGRRRVKSALPSLGWAAAPAVWSVWQVTDGFRATSLVGWKPGWVIGAQNPLAFLVVEFGLFLPLAVAALVLAWRRRRREEMLVVGPALFVLALLFFVRVAPWDWDNTKVLLWCYVVALPPIGSLVLTRLAIPWRAAVVVGLLFSGAVSVLAASVGQASRLEVLNVAEYGAVCRALEDVGVDERVATAPTFNHPAALCGQPLVAGYAGHLWSHGLDASRVQRDLNRLLLGDPGWRQEARGLGASLLFWGPREQAIAPGSRRPWEAEVRPMAAGTWGALYRLD